VLAARQGDGGNTPLADAHCKRVVVRKIDVLDKSGSTTPVCPADTRTDAAQACARRTGAGIRRESRMSRRWLGVVLLATAAGFAAVAWGQDNSRQYESRNRLSGVLDELGDAIFGERGDGRSAADRASEGGSSRRRTYGRGSSQQRSGQSSSQPGEERTGSARQGSARRQQEPPYATSADSAAATAERRAARSVESEEPATADATARSSRRTAQPGYRPSASATPRVARAPRTAPPAAQEPEDEPLDATPNEEPESSSIADDSGASAPARTRSSPAPRSALRPPPARSTTDDEAPAVAPEQPSTTVPPRTARREPAADSSPATPAPVAAGRGDFVVGEHGPALRVETSGPRRLLVGQAAPYTVVVQNEGSAAAGDVLVEVEVPDWAEVRSSDATAGQAEQAAPGTWQWRLSSVASRSREELTLDIAPLRSQSFDLTVRWQAAPITTQAQVEVLEPLLELALEGPREVSFGERTVYKLTFSNPGTADTENVTVKLLPLSPDEGDADTHTIGRIAAGATRVVEVELVARQAGPMMIRVAATADGGLTAEASSDVLVRRADLQLDVEAPQFAFAGATTSYDVTVENTGDEEARDVHLSVALPHGAEFASAAGGGREQDGQVAWEIGSLAPGERQTYTVKCVLRTDGHNELAANATAAGDLSQRALAATQVEALADLALDVSDPTGPVPVGDEVTYEIKVVNRGAKEARDVSLTVFFADGIEPVSAHGAKHALGSGQVVFDPLASLGAGEERVFKIKAVAHAPGSLVMRAEVRCDALEDSALAEEETTRFYGDSGRTLAAQEDGGHADAAAPVEAHRREPTPAERR
jgi:uncharacterized repeat protein (TIGR01451 family)